VLPIHVPHGPDIADPKWTTVEFAKILVPALELVASHSSTAPE